MHEKELQNLAIEVSELKSEMTSNRAEMVSFRKEMKPMLDAFNAIATIGKWAAIGVAFAGSLAGAIIAIKQLFKKGS